MYYLNDKHPRKEYAVYKRVNNATPYISNVFYNLKQVEEYFLAVQRNHDRYHHTYYIDMEGFVNSYPKELAQFYYKLLERPVNDWIEAS